MLKQHDCCNVSFNFQEIFYDAKNKKGHVYYKILYKKYKTATKKVRKDVEPSAAAQPEEDTIDEMEYLLFFRTCILDRDYEILKIKLAQTITLREKVMKKKETVLFKAFPFYFVRSDLVRSSFLRFFAFGKINFIFRSCMTSRFESNL